MAPGTDPSIVGFQVGVNIYGTPVDGYESAFQANTGSLWTAGYWSGASPVSG
jgi:hypothetical protein